MGMEAEASHNLILNTYAIYMPNLPLENIVFSWRFRLKAVISLYPHVKGFSGLRGAFPAPPWG